MAKYLTSDGDIYIQPSTGTTRIVGDVVITGDSTTVSSTDTLIKDNIIVLNAGESGAGVTLGNSGIEIDRGSSTNVLIRYNDTSDVWEMTNDGSTYGDIVTSITTGVFLADVVDDTTPQLGGDLDVNGSAFVSVSSGNIEFTPNGTGDTVFNAGDILPSSSSVIQNLGGSSDYWTNLYVHEIQATAITAPSVTGALIGNADTATTAGTVTTAAQPAITSVGTLTTLTVDNLNLNGNTIISTDTNGNIVFDPDGTGIVSITGTNAFQPPAGTTAQRPGAPVAGYTRMNTTTSVLEYYNGASWTAAGITITGQIFGDTFVGDGSTTAFVMSQSTTDENELFVTINGLVQEPVVAYTASGATITFTGAPALSDTVNIRNLTASQSITQVIDNDSDTYIDVEEGSDDDTIRFYTTGVERITISPTGTFAFSSGAGVTTILDEDAMGSDSATALSTQQSIRAYVDNELGALTLTTIGVGDSDITVTDAGTGTITVTVDAGTQLTINASTADFQNNAITTTGVVTGATFAGTVSTATQNSITTMTGLTTTGTVTSGTWSGSFGSVSGANLTAITAANISSGNLGSGVQPYIKASTSGTAFKVAFMESASDSAGNTNLQRDGTAGNFLYQPSTGTLTADIFSGVATTAQYADVAERYEADKEYTPGTVVVFGGSKEITESTKFNDSRVAGVVSTEPAYMMNSEAGTDQTHPYIALLGRAPCKVQGTVRKGDLLVTSGQAGVARSRSDVAPYIPGTILGKALQDHDSEEISTIEVVLGSS